MRGANIQSLSDLRKRKASLARDIQGCEDEVRNCYHNAVRIANIVRLGWKFFKGYTT